MLANSSHAEKSESTNTSTFFSTREVRTFGCPSRSPMIILAPSLLTGTLKLKLSPIDSKRRNEQIRGKSASLFYATSGRDMGLVFANVRVIASITVEFHGQVNEVFGCVQSPKTFSQLRPRDGIKRSLQI